MSAQKGATNCGEGRKAPPPRSLRPPSFVLPVRHGSLLSRYYTTGHAAELLPPITGIPNRPSGAMTLDHGCSQVSNSGLPTYRNNGQPEAQNTKRPHFKSRRRAVKIIHLEIVPQQTYYPYSYLQPTRDPGTGEEIVLHAEPRGITSQDNQRIAFHLLGNPVQSGICMALLEEHNYAGARSHIVAGDVPVDFHGRTYVYSFILFEIKWPTYPRTSRAFSKKIVIKSESGACITRAELARQIVECYRMFIEMARAEEPTPGQPHLRFGPKALGLETMWLMSIYQMCGQHFFAEVWAPKGSP